jgi:pheromone receptor transcription factor
VLLLVASETGHVYTFATPKLQPLITKPEGKNLIQSCLNAPDAPSAQAAPQQRLQGVPSGQEPSSMPMGGGGYPDHQQLPEDDHNQKDSKNFPFPPADYATAFPQPYGYPAPALHAMQRGPSYAPPPMHQGYPNAPSPFPSKTYIIVVILIIIIIINSQEGTAALTFS